MCNTSRGNSGQFAQMVMDDGFSIFGTDPNVLPALHIDPTGQAINTYGVTGSSGSIKIETALPKVTPIDNSGDFHGGVYTVVAMNKASITCGNGGFDVGTGGNATLASWGGITNIIGKVEAAITGTVVKINCCNATMINGPLLYVNTEETTFNTNAIFGNNVLVHGGMAVNGELLAQHITAIRQVHSTEFSDEQFGYPIAGATFQCLITPMGMVTTPTIPLTPAAVLPGLAMLTILPTTTPITSIPPHKHYFNGPAMTLAGSSSEMFEKMKQVERKEALEADPPLPMNKTLSDIQADESGQVQKLLSNFVSNNLT